MSRFKGILDAAKNREPEPEEAKTNDPELVPATETEMQSKQPQPEIKRGRPKGKRSNPDYEQVTAYIRRTTYRDVKIALLQRGDDREFSELVEDLLTQWLE